MDINAKYYRNAVFYCLTPDGYEYGKEVGEEDSENGYNPNGHCPEGSGLSYCAGYKLGYYIGYESHLQDNNQKRNKE